MRVGSTDDAEFAVADDREMSDLHFAVTADRSGCRLTDLQSERGTFVNGVQVQRAELADGDEIAAGRTVLKVKIDGVRPGENVAAPATTAPQPRLTRPTAPAGSARQ